MQICQVETNIYEICFLLKEIMRLITNWIRINFNNCNWFWQIYSTLIQSYQIILSNHPKEKKTVQNKLPNVICWKECNVQSHKGIICSETLLEAKKEVEILLIIYVISLSLEEVVCLKFSLLHTLVVSTMYTTITYTSSYIYHR